MPLFVSKGGTRVIVKEISTGTTTLPSTKSPDGLMAMVFEAEGHRLYVAADEAEQFTEMLMSAYTHLRREVIEHDLLRDVKQAKGHT